MYENVYEVEDKDKNYITYVGFCKAFEKVLNQRLFSKIKSSGIGGKNFKWIEMQLTNHKQSPSKQLNKLDYASNSRSKFAGDIKIGCLIRSFNNARVLQGELDVLYEWSN